MQLTVVIPVRGSVDVLRHQLASLARQELAGDWEVVIADNGAEQLDAVVSAFRGALPGLRVVDATDRRGPSHARNVGARAATGDALVFLDADDEVEQGYLAAMAAALEHSPIVAARVDHLSLNPQWGGRTVYPEWQTTGLTRAEDALLAAAGTLGVRRDLFEAVGGWDEELIGAEDDDFCRRVAGAGYPVRFVPDAVLRYRTKPTIRAHVRHRVDWGYHEARLLRRRRLEARSAGVRPLPSRRSARAAARGWARLGASVVKARSKADVAAALGGLGREVGWAVGRLRRGVPGGARR